MSGGSGGWSVDGAYVIDREMARLTAEALGAPWFAADRFAPPMCLDAVDPFYGGVPYPVEHPEMPHYITVGDVYEWYRPLEIDSPLEATTTLVNERATLRGDGVSKMILVEYETVCRDRDGAVARHGRTVAFFEGPVGTQQPQPLQRPEPGSRVLAPRRLPVDMVTLVRWAAATGDFERVHLDHRYATVDLALTAVLGHASLSAGMLCQLVADWRQPFTGRLTVRHLGAPTPGDVLEATGWIQPQETAEGAGRAVLRLDRSDGTPVAGAKAVLPHR